jgi:hypothetical protein
MTYVIDLAIVAAPIYAAISAGAAPADREKFMLDAVEQARQLCRIAEANQGNGQAHPPPPPAASRIRQQRRRAP